MFMDLYVYLIESKNKQSVNVIMCMYCVVWHNIFTMCIIIISYYIFIFHDINKGFTININMYIVKLNYWLEKIR